jgi:hypothetical protein
MIVSDPAEFTRLTGDGQFPPRGAASARGAFLVTPLGMTLAQESAQDNRYMAMAEPFDAALALAQHARLARALSTRVPVTTFPGDAETPDAVFPNNVFGTAPGRVIYGRMRHAVRRREAERADIRRWFGEVLQREAVDLAQTDCVAELTGSLIIDRARGIGFCGLSERCDEAGARAMHAAFGLRLTYCFDLAPGEYHTNVVMSVLAGRALVIARDGFADPAVAQAIVDFYAPRVVELTPAQKADYAGNCIALDDGAVWFSARAERALSEAQKADLAAWGFAIESVDLSEIEKAGGSLRCCVGEIY